MPSDGQYTHLCCQAKAALLKRVIRLKKLQWERKKVLTEPPVMGYDNKAPQEKMRGFLREQKKKTRKVEKSVDKLKRVC